MCQIIILPSAKLSKKLERGKGYILLFIFPPQKSAFLKRPVVLIKTTGRFKSNDKAFS